MGYKGLIIKIQKLKASYDNSIFRIQESDYYNPECTKRETIRFMQDFSNELDKILISEEYAMKKAFKY